MSEPELPETVEQMTPAREPFAALKRRLAERGVSEPEPDPDLEAYKPHREFELEYQRTAGGRTRFDEPTSCEGTMRIAERQGPLLHLRCDACGVEWSARMPKEDLAGYLLAQAGIPELFAGKEFDSTDEAQAPTLKACRSWIRSFKRDPVPAIALWGQAGRGKSHLLSLMLETVVKVYSVEGLYRSSISLLNELRDAVREGTFERAYGRLLSVPLLALDDLGASRMTPAAQDWFAGLVDHRYAKALPLLVATNVPPQAWADAFGERAASRLRGICLPFRLEGPDRRAQGVQESLAVA